MASVGAFCIARQTAAKVKAARVGFAGSREIGVGKSSKHRKTALLQPCAQHAVRKHALSLVFLAAAPGAVCIFGKQRQIKMADTAVRDKFVFPGAENIVVSQNISFLCKNISEFIFRIDIKQKQSIIAQEQGDAIKACGQSGWGGQIVQAVKRADDRICHIVQIKLCHILL